MARLAVGGVAVIGLVVSALWSSASHFVVGVVFTVRINGVPPSIAGPFDDVAVTLIGQTATFDVR